MFITAPNILSIRLVTFSMSDQEAETSTSMFSISLSNGNVLVFLFITHLWSKYKSKHCLIQAYHLMFFNLDKNKNSFNRVTQANRTQMENGKVKPSMQSKGLCPSNSM